LGGKDTLKYRLISIGGAEDAMFFCACSQRDLKTPTQV
jgi:hypothetical protein